MFDRNCSGELTICNADGIALIAQVCSNTLEVDPESLKPQIKTLLANVTQADKSKLNRNEWKKLGLLTAKFFEGSPYLHQNRILKYIQIYLNAIIKVCKRILEVPAYQSPLRRTTNLQEPRRQFKTMISRRHNQRVKWTENTIFSIFPALKGHSMITSSPIISPHSSN